MIRCYRTIGLDWHWGIHATLEITVNNQEKQDELSNRQRSDSATSPNPAIALHDIWFSYEPSQSIVNGVTAEFGVGRVCALIGPNAAGKTTLLRLILGQLQPTSGSLTANGRAITSYPYRQRAAFLSYVPQHGRVSFSFTAQEVVAMGRFALSANPKAIEQAILACDLEGLRSRIYSELSAGQRQRVLIARAMAQATGAGRVMLLDEPVSSMDLYHVQRTMVTLTNLARSGLAVLVVLHDLNLAARHADDVWLMHEGQLAATGPWSQVLRPEILEPVYGVKIRALTATHTDRPIFFVENRDTRILR